MWQDSPEHAFLEHDCAHSLQYIIKVALDNVSDWCVCNNTNDNGCKDKMTCS